MRSVWPHRLFILLLILSSFVFSLTTVAQDPEASEPENSIQKRLTPSEVPEALKPWVEWSLYGFEKRLCPVLEDLEESVCSWSSVLNLNLGEKTGSFQQTWYLDEADWVGLPGDTDHWPLSVQVDGQPGTPLSMEDQPYLYLTKGTHTLKGEYFWDALPESFQIPEGTGILNLNVNGRAVVFPRVDEDGLIWLEREGLPQENGEQTLEIRVHRKMVDEIPFILVTRLDLRASGKTREVILGKILPEGYVPLALLSSLQISIDPQGRLHVQVGAGEWEVEVRARHIGPVQTIELPKPVDPETLWPAEEIWAFEAKNELRLVSVAGVIPVDPKQTLLPEEWKQLPAYRVRPGEIIQLIEKRRGDADVSPDDLHLARDLWLDFSGKGYTLQDRISGNLRQSSRLDIAPPIQVGRMAVAGIDQLITKLPDRETAGVEIRQGDVDLVAEGRIEKRKFSMPALGWDREFQGVTQRLHLPPGWRLWFSTGADEVDGTWVNQWTLLELLLLFILVFSVAKIWDRKWGFIALFALVLSLSEANAPQWIWLFVMSAEALTRFLSVSGKLRGVLRFYRLVSLAILVLIFIPFSIGQIRGALYPALEQVRPEGPIVELSREISIMGGLAPKGYEPLATKEMQPEAGSQPVEVAPEEELQDQEVSAPPPIQAKREKVFEENLSYVQNIQNIPGAQIQTGPGIPKWQWSDITLRWSGAVEKDQKLRLFLFPPFLNRFLALVRVLLLALLILRLFDFPGGFWPGFFKKYLIPVTKPLFGLLMIGLVLGGTAVKAADLPTSQLLNELRERLTRPPECAPNCAALSRMEIEAIGSFFRARLEVSAGAETAIPLPGSATEWTPERVWIDGSLSPSLHRSEDGKLWLRLSQGFHQVLLEGKLPESQTVQIPLPLKPHFVKAKVQGWSLSGLHEDGQVEDNLQLVRSGEPLQGGTENLQAHNLPPFVQIERQIILGLNWEVETRVRRLSPLGQAIVLEIPLLEGESVTTESVRVEKGMASVSMGPQTEAISWRSQFNIKDEILLQASEAMAWMEVWRLDAAVIWHVDPAGIAPVRRFTTDNVWLPEWQPWPGEELRLKVQRPEGITGQTVTIDRSRLEINPGFRFTEASLALNLRSSLGGQHSLVLPKGAKLKSVLVNGAEQPIQQVQENITLPLVPGSQEIKLSWQSKGGIRPFFKTPKVDVGIANVNTHTEVSLPSKRWVLYLGGPKLGPQVLFWSQLILYIFLALALSRWQQIPLSKTQWLLFAIVLTQAPLWVLLIVVVWFLILSWRQHNALAKVLRFNLLQIFLVLLTLAAFLVFFGTIYGGLLERPEMGIEGNDSFHDYLKWFQDRSDNTLPQALIISLPVSIYRLLILGWALWVAFSALGWLKWGWQCFSQSGLWRSFRLIKRP